MRNGRGSNTGRGSSVRGGAIGRGKGWGSTTGRAGHASQLEKVSDPWVRRESNAFCFNYTHTSGPTSTSLDSDSFFLDYIARLFTEEVWMLLVTETNRYADDNIVVSPSSHAWSPVSKTILQTIHAG